MPDRQRPEEPFNEHESTSDHRATAKVPLIGIVASTDGRRAQSHAEERPPDDAPVNIVRGKGRTGAPQ